MSSLLSALSGKFTKKPKAKFQCPKCYSPLTYQRGTFYCGLCRLPYGERFILKIHRPS